MNRVNTNKESYIPKMISRKQELFLRYFTLVLIDLVVLNFFAEYWDKVAITSFGISLLVAAVLQTLIKLTIALEHRIAEYFKSDSSLKMKMYRISTASLILFGSKFVMLGILQFIFAEDIIFSGAYHGVATFIVVVIVILTVEHLITRIYKSLS